MFWKLAEKISYNMVPEADEEDREVYAYGVWILLTTACNVLEILLLGLVFGCLTESVIYLLVLMVLRSYTGGYHASTSGKCNLMVIGFYLINIVLGKCLAKADSLLLVGVILLAVEVLIWKKAPVEHENKPLTDTEKVRYRRYSILLSAGVCVAVLCLYNRYRFPMAYMAVTMLMVGGMMLLELGLQKKRKR